MTLVETIVAKKIATLRAEAKAAERSLRRRDVERYAAALTEKYEASCGEYQCALAASLGITPE